MRSRNWNYGMVFFCMMALALMAVGTTAYAAVVDQPSSINLQGLYVINPARATLEKIALSEENVYAACANCHPGANLVAAQASTDDMVQVLANSSGSQANLATDQAHLNDSPMAPTHVSASLPSSLVLTSNANYINGETLMVNANSVHRVIAYTAPQSNDMMGGESYGDIVSFQVLGR